MNRKKKEHYFLSEGGEMGDLIRDADWSKTPLGDPEKWPQSLKTMTAMMLSNPFGMYIAWGKNYTQLYNDAFLNGTYGIGTTYAGKVPANRIDFIFYDDFFDAQSFEIQDEILSDHRAIWTTLEISE